MIISETMRFSGNLHCVFLMLIFVHLANAQQNETYLSHGCDGANYTTNSTYQKNLRTLLSSLASDNDVSSGFYNSSAGRGMDEVRAIALCRGDVQQAACRNCVNLSTNVLPQRCPTQIEAHIFYENCMLRYSNQMIFHSMEEPPQFLWFRNNVSDVDRLDEGVNRLFEVLRDRAASGDDRSKFAVGETNSSNLAKIYGLAQCTPDLNKDQCYNCLELGFSRFGFTGKGEGRMIGFSCAFWYSFDKFYDPAFQPPPFSAPPPPPPQSTSPPSSVTGKPKHRRRLITAIAVSATCFSILLAGIYLFRRRKILQVSQQGSGFKEEVAGMRSSESLQFDFRAIRAASNNFSLENQLGRGGFGTVYQGKLTDGQQVAIKRLAENSGQGQAEFKNEVTLLANLQHINLVRLLGFCLHGRERLLIYEFMPNGSLHDFLFDPVKRASLDWKTRHKIVGGVARGLLYLHEDSRLKIVHRDLKASNILLDGNLTPKVSDFGMARLFQDQTRGITSRIVGTYGYMAPEYALHGQCSVKLDVYSFGVLLLEVVSGQKNSSFRAEDTEENLINFAWLNWRAGTALKMADPAIIEDGPRNEIARCIHIGLLCVQENAEARPSMASVVLMLRSHLISLPLPSQPAYFMQSETMSEVPILEENTSKTDISGHSDDSKSTNVSVNEASITELHPR